METAWCWPDPDRNFEIPGLNESSVAPLGDFVVKKMNSPFFAPQKMRFVQKHRMHARAGLPRGRGNRYHHHPLMGKRLRRCRAGIYPPTFFFPGPVHLFPPGDVGAGRRGNNTIALPRGPGPTIVAREFQLILSGIPLSLTIGPP